MNVVRAPLMLAALLLLVPQATAHQTVTATSSTGDVDLWGIPGVCGGAAPTSWPSGGAIITIGGVRDCLVRACPQDIYWFTVRLTLLDPSPGDAVAMSVLGDAPGVRFWFDDLGDVFHSSMPVNDPFLYPSDIATYDDPVADVTVQLGGCNRATTVAVTGLVVDGEVSYELTF